MHRSRSRHRTYEQGADHNAAASARLVEKLRCPKGKNGPATVRKSSSPVATTSRKRRRRVWGSGSDADLNQHFELAPGQSYFARNR